MINPVVVLVVATVVVIAVLLLLRSRRLREKYAALWVVVGLAVVVLAAFPDLLERAAGLLGFTVASNLLFSLAILLLLGVCLHLSLELSRIEDETRTLAESVAILDAEVCSLRESALPNAGDEIPMRDPEVARARQWASRPGASNVGD